LRAAAAAPAVAGLALSGRTVRASTNSTGLEVGEGVVDITPPLKVEMGGFHRKPGNERRVEGIRQSTAARALVLRLGDTRTAIVSLDIAAVGHEMARRVQGEIARRTGIPTDAIRICATHTHSMPGFCYLRQWGAIPTEFMATVERRVVEAVELAKADLAPAEVALGKARAKGGNFNRTTKTWSTDEQFSAQSTDAERWLDTTVYALQFRRTGDKRDLLWYHFSAHPVCFADDQAGPDWPGIVTEMVEKDHNLSPSYLQGHAGDVNPGDGSPWRGDHEETSRAVYAALSAAMNGAQPVKVDRLQTASRQFQVPLDMALFESWLDAYRKDPSACQSGQWVDAGFAKDWFDANSGRDLTDSHLPCALSAMQLGEVGLVFHPAELYSYYGLAIRRDSPLDNTLVVGYADGIIGYLPDPAAYAAGEYAAITVPKILDYPPFTPTAAGEMSRAAVGMLKEIAG
jgi:neutral/alkaline ceramidase-like enzyme